MCNVQLIASYNAGCHFDRVKRVEKSLYDQHVILTLSLSKWKNLMVSMLMQSYGEYIHKDPSTNSGGQLTGYSNHQIIIKHLTEKKTDRFYQPFDLVEGWTDWLDTDEG